MNENDLDPGLVLELVAKDVPRELHANLLIVGSLAAAYHHREDRDHRAVRTKDADVIVQPAGALAQCRDIAERLLDVGWRRTELCWACESAAPANDLRILRLHPPDTNLYFIELLGLPLPDQVERKRMVPCELRDGWYVVPCFRFMAVLTDERRTSETGIEYASPAMMALANLLSHPTLGTATIGDTAILRSAKDLGRVLALSFLASQVDLDGWSMMWWTALGRHFSGEAAALAEQAGNGVRDLLDDPIAFDDAFGLASSGLLSGRKVTKDQFRIAGRRLLGEIVWDLQGHAGVRE